MSGTPIVYRALARTLIGLAPLARGLSPKLATGDRGRRGAAARWVEWARRERDPARPLLWCHAPSVGEGLQAEAVLRLLHAAHPDWQIAYSYFSPSAEALARRMPADRSDYVPYDVPSATSAALEGLAPRALVFTKLDLWPELATGAAARGTRVGLIAATVSPVSGRLGWPARALARAGYRAVDRAGAVSEADAARLVSLGVPAGRTLVTGDPRFDSAARRAGEVPDDDPLPRLAGGAAARLVAGSTWPADDDALLAAFRLVRARRSDARLLLVPHEPTPNHVALTRRLALDVAGVDAVPLSEVDPAGGGPPIVIADRVGVLARLYQAGSVAYVGGGFGRSGLHSVLEPAACGRPVIVGPAASSSRDADLLREHGALIALPAAGAAAALADAWTGWLDDDHARDRAGAQAREVINAGLGSAERTARLVEELMGEVPNGRR